MRNVTTKKRHVKVDLGSGGFYKGLFVCDQAMSHVRKSYKSPEVQEMVHWGGCSLALNAAADPGLIPGPLSITRSDPKSKTKIVLPAYGSGQV